MKVSPELDTRFRDAAAEAGFLDVAYDIVDTPIGPLFVAATGHGLCRISYDPEPDRVVEGLARTLGVARAPVGAAGGRDAPAARRVLRTPADGVRARRSTCGWPPDFSRRVLDELARVPYGEVTTYGELARRAERPRAARAVGTVMNRNPIPIVLPCHRVVGASGSLMGYGGGLDRKEALLKLEGAIL